MRAPFVGQSHVARFGLNKYRRLHRDHKAKHYQHCPAPERFFASKKLLKSYEFNHRATRKESDG